ncbi:MAG: lactonase family protein [Planctomycetota bacterium]
MRFLTTLLPAHGMMSACLPATAVLFWLVGSLLTSRTLCGDEPNVLVSSFAAVPDGGILSFRLDTTTGTLTPGPRSPVIPNPFFFDVTPDRRRLYSIHAETFGGTAPESTAAFELNAPTDLLTAINRETTRGTASCYVEVDRTGRCVLVANYSSGDVISYRIQADGRLSAPVSFHRHSGRSVNVARQNEPHAHCIVISPNNRFAYAADLGTDQIVCYQLDAATAQLSAAAQPFVRLPPGSGPRHLTFHPREPWMYVINELLNTVTAFEWNADTGMLIERGTESTLPADFTGESWCADLKITPDGRSLYGTNRGHDSLAMFRIGEDGRLTRIGIISSGGTGPQNLAITADGGLLLCANMSGNTVAVFRIQAETGILEMAGPPVTVKMPSCIRILP